MTLWIVTEEDEDPVTALELECRAHGNWAYRHDGSEAPFQLEIDGVLIAKLNLHYAQYLNSLIVGKTRRATKASPLDAL